MNSDMQEIRNQINQKAISINHLESQSQEKLSFQPEVNPKNLSVITLRIWKEVEGQELVTSKDKNEEWIEKELEKERMRSMNSKVIPNSIIKVRTNPPPFPNRLEKLKTQGKENEILEVFRKVAINISLLDAIKQVPKYAKFLKNLCVNKKKLRGNEPIVVHENVSVIFYK